MLDTRSSNTVSTEWVSIHVFYGGDTDALLTRCVAPLVRRLRDQRLIRRYFFIRYWLEGSHVRLRLLPAPGVRDADLAGPAEACLAEFLAEHPAPPAGHWPTAAFDEQHRQLFLKEYDQATWDRKYGPDGSMPVRDDNSFRYEPYEPEYPRYGGPRGVELAEQHFEVSSDLVLRLLADLPPGRPARLALSAQLTLVLGVVFLGEGLAAVRFFSEYRDFWNGAYGDASSRYDEAYPSLGEWVRRRAHLILSAVRAENGADVSATSVAGWLTHCRALRMRAERVQDVTLPRLLHSYVHMTNNRLGITVLEEAYIAHLLQATLSS